MVEVHVFNVFLWPEIKKEVWFSTLNFVNGMVTTALILLMIAVAISWGTIKKNNPERGRKIFTADMLGSMLIFSLT